MFYVYKITNLVNNKIYIGKAKNIKIRWNAHQTAARKKDPRNYSYIHKAMNKYGFDNFEIARLAEHEDEKECLRMEKEYVRLLQSNDRNIGYNLTEGGEGSSSYRHTDEAKQKMSELRKGKFTAELNHFYGKKHTNKVKKQLSAIASERIKDKNPFYGKKHSNLSRDKMRANSKPKSKFLTAEDIEDIKYKKNLLGMSFKKIAEEYGMDRGTISKAARGAEAYAFVNQITPPIKAKAPKLSDEQISDIKYKYFELKLTFKEIARQYNMRYKTISDAAQNKGTYALKPEIENET